MKKLKPKKNTKLEPFCLYAVKVILKAGSIPELVPKGLGTMRQLHHGGGWSSGTEGGTRLMWIVPRTSSCC